MQFDLVSGSEHGSHALFDPTVLEPMEAGEDWHGWLERQVTSGRMLYYSRGDEELRLKLLVDEPFEPRGPCNRTGEVDGAILRVPSGRLCLMGIEAVHDAGETDVAQAGVFAGAYRVTAFRAQYRLSRDDIAHELAPQLEPGDAEYVRRIERALGPLAGALMLGAILAAFVFLVSHSAWRLPAAAASLAVGVVAGLLVWRLYASPRVRRWNRAKDALWKRYPRTVVVLRRLPGDEIPATFPPGRFGGSMPAK